MADSPKRRGPRSWTADEWHRLLAAVDSLPLNFQRRAKIDGKKTPVCQATFWRAFLLVARDSGLAVSTILALRKDQLAPNGTLVVHFDNPPRDAIIRLMPDTLAALSNAHPDKSRLVAFPCRQERSLTTHWRLLLKRAGLPDSLWVTETNRLTDRHVVPETAIPEGEKPKTLLQFYRSHYAPLRLRGRSARTDDLYRYTIANFQRYLGHAPVFADLNDWTVSGLLEWMRKRGLSPHSVNKERDQLLAMWRFACLNHFVKDYPNVQKEILPERAPMAWLMTEVRTLFASLDYLPGKIGKVPAAAWWKALLLTLYDTGERISAIMQLRRSDFDFENSFVLVPAEFRKGKRRDKLSKLRPATMEAVKALPVDKGGLAFHWPYTAHYIFAAYSDVLKHAGLPTDRKSKFHRIRRTVASYYEKAGGDAMKLLDHTSRCVTAKYLDPRLVEVDHACDLLPSPLAGEGTVAP